MTAVVFKCQMPKDGRRTAAHRVCLPSIVPVIETADADGDLALGAEASADFAAAFGCNGSDEILMASKMCLGWMCSYRTAQPEKRKFSDWRARWTKARLRYADVPLLQPRLRRSQEEQKKLQDEWRKRRHINRAPG